MTLVCAAWSPDIAEMCADDSLDDGDSGLRFRADDKVFAGEDYLLGFAGDAGPIARIMQVLPAKLRYALSERFPGTRLSSLLQSCQEGEEVSALLADHTGLWFLDSHGACSRVKDRYLAIGSGDQAAMGILTHTGGDVRLASVRETVSKIITNVSPTGQSYYIRFK
jgi:20S proteasome alpha/beta subunit